MRKIFKVIYSIIFIINKGLCKRICESYVRNESVKKAESAKIINLVIKNKEKSMKASFLDNFKARVKIENVMRKYVKGFSKDRVKKKRMEEFYRLNSAVNDLSDSRSFNFSQNLRNNNTKNSNYQSSKSFNITLNA